MLVEHLQKTFAERSRKNPSYSLRSFARSLEIDSSTLSAILRRKRRLSAKTAKLLLDRLGINDPEQVRSILLGCISDSPPAAEPVFNELDLAHAEMVSSWEHVAILEATELAGFTATTRNLSQRLGIPFAIVTECLARLKLLNLVSEEDGVFKKTHLFSATPSNVPSSKLRDGHRQCMQKAIEALDGVPVERRMIYGMTMAINSSRMKEAQPRIQRFTRELSAFLTEGPCDSVYCFNVQLFPLDQEQK